MIYGAKELADAFRTVRRNTLQIAEDIPEEQYGFRATPAVQSVAEELAHIACSPMWQIQAHAVDKKTFIAFDEFGAYMVGVQAEQKALAGKGQILQALSAKGETFASFLESLTDAQLAEKVGFPPPVQPSHKTRLEMLMGAKEHEMHHRAKLMLVQRLLGIVPHLTRRRMEAMATTR
jgi:uncharacterized damage-inducible protein DinB